MPAIILKASHELPTFSLLLGNGEKVPARADEGLLVRLLQNVSSVGVMLRKKPQI